MSIPVLLTEMPGVQMDIIRGIAADAGDIECYSCSDRRRLDAAIDATGAVVVVTGAGAGGRELPAAYGELLYRHPRMRVVAYRARRPVLGAPRAAPSPLADPRNLTTRSRRRDPRRGAARSGSRMSGFVDKCSSTLRDPASGQGPRRDARGHDLRDDQGALRDGLRPSGGHAREREVGRRGVLRA